MSKFCKCLQHLSALAKARRRQYWIVPHGPGPTSLPSQCACCLAAPVATRRESGVAKSHGVIVPYCGACLRHAGRSHLLLLGTTYASVLLALFGGLLLSATWDSRVGTSLVAGVLATLPWLLHGWVDLPRQLGHAGRGRAVIVLAHELACASRPFAELMVTAPTAVAPRNISGESRWPTRAALGPVLGILLTPFLNQLFFPAVRVLNLTDQTIDVWVDQRKLDRVAPTSGESPAAGKTMHLPSGRHRLRAQYADGTVVADDLVEVRFGFQHLYAPGSSQDCFYLQRVSFGQSTFEGEEMIQLQSTSRFWAIGSDVDLWFTPDAAAHRSSTTGGVVTLLRMGRCR